MNVILSPEVQKRLADAASRRGLDPAALARQLIEENLPNADGMSPNQATLALLEQWEREERTEDPAELAQRQREGEELMRNLARNRQEMEGSNARKLWP